MPGFTTAGGKRTTATTYRHSSMTCSPKWTLRPEAMIVAGGRRMTPGHTRTSTCDQCAEFDSRAAGSLVHSPVVEFRDARVVKSRALLAH